MPNCVTCGKYFHNSPYNNSSQCDDCYCADDIEDISYDIYETVNKNGVTKSKNQDYSDDDSFGL